MDESEALVFIELRLSPGSDPELTPGEVTDLLRLAGTADAAGNDPGSDGWTPTYSTVGCYRAIAEGWNVKHGKASGRFDFTTDGQTFRRQQQLDNIEHQRNRWARKVQQSPSTLGIG